MTSTIQQRNPFRNWSEAQQCVGEYSRDQHGTPINPRSPNACVWCVLGWLKFMGIHQELITAFNQWCLDNLGRKTLAELNDVDGWLPQNFEAAWNRFMTEAIEASKPKGQ